MSNRKSLSLRSWSSLFGDTPPERPDSPLKYKKKSLFQFDFCNFRKMPACFFVLTFICISVVFGHVRGQTVSGLERLGTDPALDHADAEVVRLEVLPHVAAVKGDLATEEAGPGALVRNASGLTKESFKVSLTSPPW